ncbi:MAG: hypothetical protein AUK58_03540 [Candidatus Moranbacteria bacterium CG2_30_41_165]|nr:MAG: hypothetical protein AUK58_03540 [Candidatus Moranbacteria bacterium CG2_30_41_165]
MDVSKWSVDRMMFVLGGFLVVVCVMLSVLIHPYFIFGSLFIGIMFIIFALTGYCPGAIIVAKIMKKDNAHN